jgi:dihydroneopterin aldolase
MEHATASGTVSLEGMAFFARHGFYEEERTLGNRYEVDIAVETPLGNAATNDELAGTVNYEGLYRIVREEMETPSKLLEHVAGRILERTCREFSHHLLRGSEHLQAQPTRRRRLRKVAGENEKKLISKKKQAARPAFFTRLISLG